MVYKYVCLICSFIFHCTKTYEFYECPSCHKVVQAIPLVEKEEKDVIKSETTVN